MGGAMTNPRIRLHNIEKRFPAAHGQSMTAVTQLNLAVQPGEFVVLLGPSGCGKTTTLRMMAGLDTPTTGQVFIDEQEVTTLRPGQRDIAFVFQMFALYPHLTAWENIAFPLRAKGLAKAEIKNRVDQLIARLGLTKLAQQRPKALSGGDQQRISLARAMVRQPKAFLMDEPLGTLDADQRERTRLELRAIHNQLGATTVFVTHDQLEAMSLADRIAVMSAGKLLQYAPPREVYDQPADLFVANFIGSPGMNLLAALLQPEGDYAVENSPLCIPRQGSGNAPAKLILGIRPEYVRIDSAGTQLIVEHTERLGAYNLVSLRIGGKILKARLPAQDHLAESPQLPIRLDPAGIRWFDPVSGQNLSRSLTAPAII